MPSRRPLARALAAVGTAAALLAAGAAPALAHGGTGATWTGEAGPFTVSAYDARKGSSDGRLEYRVILTDTASGTPVNDATVTLEARRDGETLEVQAEDVANIYYYELPDPRDGSWDVTARIAGPAGGAGTATFEMHGLEDDAPADALADGGTEAGGGASGTAAVLGLLAAAGLLGVLIGALRLRRRPTAHRAQG